MRTPASPPSVRSLILAAAAAALAAGPLAARANCARPIGFSATVATRTVSIQPINFEARGCPAAGGMLRQDAATGETVRLADFCGPAGAEPDQGLPYLDECVPGGTFRYGFATPYACSHTACSTEYFTVVTLPPAPPGCLRSDGNAAPTAFGTPPWGDRQEVCTYAFGGGCGTVPSGSGAVLLLDGAVLLFGLALLRHQRRR